MRLMTFLTVLLASLAIAHAAYAVSVRELISQCGDDAKIHCEGVDYGDPMQACLDKTYKKLSAECRLVMDRLRDGEKVTLL